MFLFVAALIVHCVFSVRLYDCNTFQCFVSANPADQHKGPLTAVSIRNNVTFHSSQIHHDNNILFSYIRCTVLTT